jgi:hypothetical protein
LHTEYDRLGRVHRVASAAIGAGNPFDAAWSLTESYHDSEDRLLASHHSS